MILIRKPLVVIWAVACVAAVWGLLCLYGEAGTWVALGTAAVCVATMAAGVWAYAFAARFTVWKAGIAVSVAVAAIGIVWGITAISGWYGIEIIPLLMIGGGAGWVWLKYLLREPDAILPSEEIPAPPPQNHQTIDRITVKKGSEIHIVRADELQYILSEGDYVMLYTAGGRYLKEQTMRWYEENLPAQFVRIHRSCIVNIDEIARVELFGKENYRVRLKDGAVLKASATGYRALKIRLGL